MKTRSEMIDAIVAFALKQPCFSEGKELSLKLMLTVSDTQWIAQQYSSLGLTAKGGR